MKSEWADVLSGVPQGTVLGPSLFMCNMNDLPQVIHTNVEIFTDDTKLFTDASVHRNTLELQHDIDRLQEWQLSLNPSKCKVMYIDIRNPEHHYDMTQNHEMTLLEKTKIEKDLEVHTDNQPEISTHPQLQVNMANRILGMIRRSFSHMDKESMRQLYTSQVRPQLEYGHAITYPRYEKDKKLLEQVQRRATKLIPELKEWDCVDRLKALDLHSPHYRRDRGT